MNKIHWWVGTALLCALAAALGTQMPQAQAPTDPLPALLKKQAECQSLFPERTEEASRDLIEKQKKRLSGANLRGLRLEYDDLSGLDLSKADLTASRLHGADFKKANLEGATLLLADLQEANFKGANLAGADLRGAQLYLADMTQLSSPPARLPPGWVSVQHSTILDETFEEVEVAEGVFEQFSSHSAPELEPWAVLGTGSDASYLKLHQANFTGARLMEINFEEADLRGANFTDASLQKSNFTQARLKGSNFTGADLTGAIFTQAQIKGAIWNHTTCPDGTKSDEAADKTCNKHLKAAAKPEQQPDKPAPQP